MARLQEREFRAALTVVGDAYSAESVDEFVERVLPPLRELVGADVASFATSPGGEAPTGWRFDPSGEPFPGASETFTRLFPDHPFSAYLRLDTRRTLKLSDFFTLTRLRQLPFYFEVFERMSANHQIATTLLVLAPGPLGVGLGFSRDRPDFTERERTLLDLVNPQLARAYAAAVERARLRAAGSALEAAVARSGSPALVVERTGAVSFTSEAARTLVAEYFGAEARDRLPEPVLEWLEAGRSLGGPAQPFVAKRPDATLVVRYLPWADTPGRSLLLLDERRQGLAPARLREAGLTRREAEIVALIAAGRTNAQIADDLNVSKRTVDKHVENVLRKLGAANRAEAVAILAAAPSSAT